MLAQCDEPGATVVDASSRLRASASFIHGWRKLLHEAARIADEPLQFSSYGAVPTPYELVVMTPPVSKFVVVERRAPLAAAGALSPGNLSALILPPAPAVSISTCRRGVRLPVDGYVDERSLTRMLRMLP